MTTNEGLIFAGMVFVAIVLLGSALIVPTAGTAAQASRKMRMRIGRHLDMREPGTTSLLREQYLKELSPLERAIEKLPLISQFSYVVEQSGIKTSGAKVVTTSLIWGPLVAIAVFILMKNVPLAILLGVLVFFFPIGRIVMARNARLARFEEQLPEALDIMSRALKAGHPFNETLNLVSEEMQDPIGGEFGRIFSDINFGLPLKTALQGILTRVPSASMHTLITAVLIQSESGGKLAEILEKVAIVIRGRFKLQRKIKSLSAEGRMSAWILSLIPFALAAMISVINPGYLPVLLNEPLGIKLIMGSFFMLIVGVFWIRSIIQIQV